MIISASSSGMAFVELELVKDEVLTLTVPENSTYSITELAGAYTASYQITDSTGLNLITNSAAYNTEENKLLSTKTETADAGEEVAVVFTNVKNVRQKLTLLKELSNVPEGTVDQFTFKLRLSDLTPGCLLNTSFGRLTADDSGTLVVEFTLLSGRRYCHRFRCKQQTGTVLVDRNTYHSGRSGSYGCFYQQESGL